MYHSNKLLLFFLLLILPFLSSCSDNKSDAVGKFTTLDVIFDPEPGSLNADQLEDLILKYRMKGIKESFFEKISIYTNQPQIIPRGKNLLLLLKSDSPLFNSSFKSLFSPEFLKSVDTSTVPVTLIREDLFYRGQKVFIILTGKMKPDPRKYHETLSLLITKIVISSITSINKDIEESSDNGLSDTLRLRFGLNINIPAGFEVSHAKKDNSAILMRRGIGSKTEEWICIVKMKESQTLPGSEEDVKSLRDDLVTGIIQFSDGSVITTTSAVLLDTVGNRFRGEWSTSPYPMAGCYSGKIVDSDGKKFYIEAGIYSPGRSKTLNLLRLENSLYFNR